MIPKLNYYRIFKRYYITNNIYIDLSKINLLKNVVSYSFISTLDNYPKVVFYDKPVLNILSDNVCAKKAKVFSFDFNESINVSDKEVLAFGFNSRSDCNFLDVELISNNNKNFIIRVSVNSERWNNLILDVSSCSFLSNISCIKFTLYGASENYVVQSNFQISDLRFGNILDFSFKRGNALKYFEKKDNLFLQDNSLIFKFNSNDFIIFPKLERPRYSELNALIYIRDSVKITMQNNSCCSKFRLYIATDKKREFSNIRFVEFYSVPFSQLESYIISLKSITFDSDERIYCLKLVTLNGEGEIQIKEVSFEQEEDFLTDKNAIEFLQKKVKNKKNPYGYKSINKIYNAFTFGAKGNGFTNDNEFIQSAIDYAYKQGGGKVFLNGNKRYIITNLVLKSNVELIIEEGSILLQSTKIEDYNYHVQFEHDNIYATVNWAHNFLVNNKPLISASDSHNIKITGGGTIRCMDSGCEKTEFGFPLWPEHCGGTIHCAPIGLNNCSNIEISNIKINRANTYHCFLVHCENIFISNVKMFDVRCLSADGIGLSGCKNVLIQSCFIQTNDDGITLCSMYDDPRAGGWWKSSKDLDNCVRNIEIANSYINSSFGGSGKAIAFITWGTDAKDQSLQEIDNINVHDCILNGGHSIGAWADNPYNGKQPFDNSEIDDFSPVKNIFLKNNKYLSKVSLECIKATNVVTDCGLHSSIDIVNGNFDLGLSNWNYVGNVILQKKDNYFYAIIMSGSKLYECIYGQAGLNKYILDVSGKGEIFIEISNYVKKIVFNGHRKKIEISINLNEDIEIKIGIKSKNSISNLYNIIKG
jgi:hypothetical protein